MESKVHRIKPHNGVKVLPDLPIPSVKINVPVIELEKKDEVVNETKPDDLVEMDVMIEDLGEENVLSSKDYEIRAILGNVLRPRGVSRYTIATDRKDAVKAFFPVLESHDRLALMYQVENKVNNKVSLIITNLSYNVATFNISYIAFF